MSETKKDLKGTRLQRGVGGCRSGSSNYNSWRNEPHSSDFI